MAASHAHASVTALINIPIADILSHRQVSYNYAAGGTERDIDKGISHAQGVQIGLFDRVELGWDNDFLGEHTFNAKVLLVNTKDSALSAGIWGWKGKSNELYVVGRHDFADFRLHGGMQRVAGKWLPFAGADGACGKKGCCKDWSWMAEVLAGEDAKFDVGLNIPLPVNGLLLTPTYSVPIKNGGGHNWNVFLTYGFRF